MPGREPTSPSPQTCSHSLQSGREAISDLPANWPARVLLTNRDVSRIETEAVIILWPLQNHLENGADICVIATACRRGAVQGAMFVDNQTPSWVFPVRRQAKRMQRIADLVAQGFCKRPERLPCT